MGPTKKKILLLLLAGIALGFAYTTNRQWRILKELTKEWKKIDQEKLKQNIRSLYRSRLIKAKENPDGTSTYILSNQGKVKALSYRFEKMKVSKEKWDEKWRIIMFDIPEKMRKGRDALRWKLKKLGFYEFQKSVFIFPFNCKDEIEFLIEFFGLNGHVRYGVLETIDNELHLKRLFHLL